MSRTAPKKKLPGTYAAPPAKKRLRSVSAPAAQPAEARDRSRLPGAYVFALSALGFGTMTGLALVFVALGLLAAGPGGTANASGEGASPQPAASEHSHAPGTPEDHAHPAAPAPADITIGVRQREGLRLDVRAKVMLQDKELIQSQVAAYADMATMPGAHAIGPVPMRELQGQPGVYEAALKLPMVGEYEVRVEVTDPIQADARKVVKVGTITSP